MRSALRSPTSRSATPSSSIPTSPAGCACPVVSATTCTASTAPSPGIDSDGGFADFLKTSARSVVKLGPGLEPKDIAALADAGLTAIHAVKKAIPVLGAGTRVVVIGAGGLGHIGIQCLKAYTPAEVIVIDPSEQALALAGEMGADQTVKVDGTQVDTVKEMTDGFGAEAIIDFVGEKGAIEHGIAMVRDGGFYYVIGYGENINIPTIDVISREISFIGNLVGTYADLQELMTLTAQGKVTLHTSTYPLDAINDAMADLDGGRLRAAASSSPPAPRRHLSHGQDPLFQPLTSRCCASAWPGCRAAWRSCDTLDISAAGFLLDFFSVLLGFHK